MAAPVRWLLPVRLGLLSLLLAGFTGLAIVYPEGFWLWLGRGFQLSFIVYVAAVIYGLYVFIPKLGAGIAGQIVQSLPMLLVEGLKGFGKSEKMKELGALGNEAKAAKAEWLTSIAQTDPLKAVIIPYVTDGIRHSKSIPPAMRGIIESTAEGMIQTGPNFTEVVLPKAAEWLDKLLPNLKIGENLKAYQQLQKIQPVNNS